MPNANDMKEHFAPVNLYARDTETPSKSYKDQDLNLTGYYFKDLSDKLQLSYYKVRQVQTVSDHDFVKLLHGRGRKLFFD